MAVDEQRANPRRKLLFQCILCASAFLVQFTAFGCYRGFGSIYVSMQETFAESNAMIVPSRSLAQVAAKRLAAIITNAGPDAVLPDFVPAYVPWLPDSLDLHYPVYYQESLSAIYAVGPKQQMKSWTGSLSLSMVLLLSPFSFKVLHLVGYRISICLGGILIGLSLIMTSMASNIYTIYFTLGIVFALGQSLCYFGTLLILPLYFKENVSFAHGIVMCGSSLGGLAQAPGLGFIFHSYGFSRGMRLVSITSLLVIAVSVVFKKPEESFGPNSLECRKMKQKEVTKKSRKNEMPLTGNYAYVIYVVSSMFISFGVFIPFVHLVRLSMDAGVLYTRAIFLPGIISFAQAVGKLTFGKLASFPKLNKIVLCQGFAVAVGVVTSLVPVLSSFAGLTFYSILFGFADGCISASAMLILRDLVPEKQFSRGCSSYFICTCLALLAGPPFAGYLYTVSETYSLAFFISGGAATIGGLLLFAVQYLHLKDEQKRQFSEGKSSKMIFSFMEGRSKPATLLIEIPADEISVHSSLTSLHTTQAAKDYVDDFVPLKRIDNSLNKGQMSSYDSDSERCSRAQTVNEGSSKA